jgi:curved DNA-binding protein CbpA
MRLGEVVAISGLPEEETRRAVYALALSGMLERTGWPRALPADALGHVRAPVAVSEESAHAAEQPSLADEVETPPVAASVETDPQKILEELFERAEGTTHYEVLGVVSNALADDIKRTYYAHAKRFHPDLFRRDADQALHQRIEAAFAKITQAYEVLKDPTLRASYDIKLATKKSGTSARRTDSTAKAERTEAASARRNADAEQADSATLQKAEQDFQQGLAALQRNDYALARRLFGDAAANVPKQARYRAYFGHTLMRDKASRRQAESELLTAILLESTNAIFHVMLAELYVEVNLRRKAEIEVERALAIEPGNSRARLLLEELRRAG